MMCVKNIICGCAFYCSVTLILSSFGVPGLAMAQSNAGPHPFDIVSIRPSNGTAGMMWDCSQSRLNARSISVDWVIQRAYDLYPFQVTNVPKPFDDDLFDIQAKVIEPDGGEVPGDRTVRDCNRAGVQDLLVNRFHLRYHWEQKEQPVYILLLDKEARLPKRSTSGGTNGVLGHGRIQMTGVTMDDLAKFLSSDVQRTVLNRTGVSGRFDIELKWSPDLTEDESRPSLFTALKEQLGLRVEAQKAPGKVLVVDQLEEPSQN